MQLSWSSIARSGLLVATFILIALEAVAATTRTPSLAVCDRILTTASPHVIQLEDIKAKPVVISVTFNGSLPAMNAIGLSVASAVRLTMEQPEEQFMLDAVVLDKEPQVVRGSANEIKLYLGPWQGLRMKWESKLVISIDTEALFGCVGDAQTFVVMENNGISVQLASTAVTTVAAAGLVGMLASPSVVVDAAVLGGLGQVACAARNNRYELSHAFFLVGPFAMQSREEVTYLAKGKQTALMANLVVIGVFFTLCCIAVLVMRFFVPLSRAASFSRFPSLPYAAGLALHPGITVLSFELLFNEPPSAISVVGAIYAVLLPAVTGVVFLRRYRPHRPGDDTPLFDDPDRLMLWPYPEDRIQTILQYRPMVQRALPRCRWGSWELRQRYGSAGRMLVSHRLLFMLEPPLQSLILGIIFAIPAPTREACGAKYGLASALLALVVVGSCYFKPYRAAIWGTLQQMAHALLAGISGVSGMAAYNPYSLSFDRVLIALAGALAVVLLVTVTYGLAIVTFENWLLGDLEVAETIVWQPAWDAQKVRKRRMTAGVQVFTRPPATKQHFRVPLTNMDSLEQEMLDKNDSGSPPRSLRDRRRSTKDVRGRKIGSDGSSPPTIPSAAANATPPTDFVLEGDAPLTPEAHTLDPSCGSPQRSVAARELPAPDELDLDAVDGNQLAVAVQLDDLDDGDDLLGDGLPQNRRDVHDELDDLDLGP